MISVGSRSFQLFCTEACTLTMISPGSDMMQMLKHMQLGQMMMSKNTGPQMFTNLHMDNPQPQPLLPVASVQHDQGAVPLNGVMNGAVPQNGAVPMHGAVPQGAVPQGAVPQGAPTYGTVPTQGAQSMVPADDAMEARHSHRRGRRSSRRHFRIGSGSISRRRRGRGRGHGGNRSGSEQSIDLNEINLRPTSYLTRSFATSDNIPSNCLMVRKLPRAT